MTTTTTTTTRRSSSRAARCCCCRGRAWPRPGTPPELVLCAACKRGLCPNHLDHAQHAGRGIETVALPASPTPAPAAPPPPTATPSSPPERTVTFEGLLDLIWPRSADRIDLLRLNARLPADSVDRFFRRGPAGWRALLSGEAGSDIETFVLQHPTDPITWSPVPFPALNVGAPGPLPVLWASLALPTTAHPLGDRIRKAASPEHEAAALRRLETCALPPTVVIDGGHALAGLWWLTEPLEDRALAVRLLHRLSITALGQALWEPIDLSRALLPLPGARVIDFIPGRLSTIIRVEPARRYPVAELAAWLLPPADAVGEGGT